MDLGLDGKVSEVFVNNIAIRDLQAVMEAVPKIDTAAEQELGEARLPAWERPGYTTPPDDVEVTIPGYGSMMIGQIKRKLADMLREAAEDAAKDPPQYSHLDGGVIQALHQALKDNSEQ